MVYVCDNTTGVPYEVMHQRIKFAAYDAYPVGIVDTTGVVMGLNHRYSITVIPSGPKGSSCSVDDMFSGPEPPVVSFYFAMDHMNVMVDASGAYDPDGTIVAYDWTFGDSGVASGLTASHSYVEPGTYTITLTLIDNDGLTSSTNRIVDIVDNPPVALFTYSASGLTVNVDASGSSDDYGIVSYAWDWGDGTTGTGMTASHTYVTAESVPIDSEYLYLERSRPSPPHPVFGYTYGPDGVTPMYGCDVTVTNLRTGESLNAETDPNYAVYSVDLYFPSGWIFGDMLRVTATKGTYLGWTEAPVTNSPEGYDWIDVTLLAVEGIVKTITLTVTDTIIQTNTVNQSVTLVPPPIASFNYTVNGATVNVDASGSSAYAGIAAYEWDWGDGTTGTGIIASHTYGTAKSVTVAMGDASLGRDRPAPPVPVWGFTYGPDGATPWGGCDLTITNLRTGDAVITTSDLESGIYVIDMSQFQLGWIYGDILDVTATKGTYVGWAQASVTDNPNGYIQIDVTLNGTGQTIQVTITLKVTDNFGLTGTDSKQIDLVAAFPPSASFTVSPPSGNVSTVFMVDASSSFDFDDPISSLMVRWDWESDGNWDTNWTVDKVAYHTYSSPEVYAICLEVMDTGGLCSNSSRQVLVTSVERTTILDEPFDSYASLDLGWSIWNYTGKDYNHFEILNGTLYGADVPDLGANDSWNAHANWTRPVVYNESLTISFSIYLPTASSYKEGYWGQWLGLWLYDTSGNPLLMTRWFMDQWSGAPSGWIYADAVSHWARVCSFTAGWHQAEIIMSKGMSTWTAVFDGVSYPGLLYYEDASLGFDISKISFINALREEAVVVMIDDLRIEATGSYPPADVPPVAVFSVVQSYLDVTCDGSRSYDFGGTVVSYVWSFGDGSTASGMTASHTYASAGTYTIVLTVTDDDGLTGSRSRQVTVESPPPPVALFTYTVDTLTVNVDASGSYHLNGTIVSYSWFFGDGSIATGMTANHTYASGGSYTIVLRVTDEDGMSGSLSQQVTVELPPPPTASFVYAVSGLTVNVDASISTGNGIVSYVWDWGDGTSGSGMTASHTYATAKSVSTSQGWISSAKDAPAPPRPVWGITYAPDSVTPLGGCEVTVTNMRTGESIATASYLDSGVYSIDMSQFQLGWIFGDMLNVTATKGAFTGWTEAPVTDNELEYDQIDVVLLAGEGQPIEVTITLTITDSFGRTGNVSKRILLCVPSSPVARLSVTLENLNVTVDGSGSFDPDGTIESYVWDFGDGTGATGLTAAHSYALSGTYTITLVVIDNDGLTGVDLFEIEGPPIPPVARFTLSGSMSIAVDESGSYDPDGTIVSYAWDFGDGSTATGMTASHTYINIGIFRITLTVTDNDGVSGWLSAPHGAW
jgi:PKD repeat protein